HLERTVDEMASELRSEEADLRLRIAGARARLLKARDGRARPGRDEKILADWNGLMIATMAFASRVLDETRYREAARRAARLVLDRMRRGGRLLHSYKDGDLRHAGSLTAHADMLWALLELYAATFETAWVDEARGLAEGIIEFFGDDPEGGFFLTAKDHETLIARTRENNDGATPAGVSVAAL